MQDHKNTHRLTMPAMLQNPVIRQAMVFFAWSVATAAILYAALAPEGGVMFQSPTAAACLGLIGFGLCLDRKQKQSLAKQAVTAERS